MKKIIILFLLPVALCFCHCKKNRGGDYDTEAAETAEDVEDVDVLVDSEGGPARMSPRTPQFHVILPCTPLTSHYILTADGQCVPFEYIPTVYVDTPPKPLMDGGAKKKDVFPKRWEPGLAAETYLKWKKIVRDTIPSMLRRALNGADDETIAAVSAIMRKEAATLERMYDFDGGEEKEEVMIDVDFEIIYNDDNYIAAWFGGHVTFETYPSLDRVVWPIKVDIRNKRRLILNDIVRIDKPFVARVFKELADMFREELDSNVNDFYTIKELKDLLIKADVFENGDPPSITCYFNASELVINFAVPKNCGSFRVIELPLSEIRANIILPDFPVGSE